MTHYTRKLLEDNPTKDDAFLGGGHQRVAKSLARTIVDLDKRDAVIGLDGGWGSGKSSVIEMAQDKLLTIEKDKKFFVMTFDLWANQSLYFRRAFLEQFIEWALGESELSDTKKKRSHLKDIAKIIGGREQVVETSTKAHFNLLGAVFVLMLPLFPILYAWLSPLATKPTPLPVCDPDCTKLSTIQNWLVTHGTEISLALLGLLFSFAIAKYISLVWNTRQPIESLKQLAGLVERKTEDNIERKLIRDVDPSNTEFSKTFRDLLNCLQTSQKRVVIVFDNVDRLSNSHASLAWSDLQAVLLRQASPSEETVLTAVVPYDREVIVQAIFSQSKDTEESIDSQDLFRKSFDAIHHISPPVISDIDSFVKAQLAEALGTQIDKETKDRVSRIFDLFGAGNIKTPRQVTAFVNEVSTIWVEWENEIPFDAAAVFVSNRKMLEADRSAAKIAEISQGAYGYRVECTPAELEEYLAMLSFSAPKELAMQVALTDPVRRHLVEENSIEFRDNLSSSAAFAVILGRLLDDKSNEIARSVQDFENAIGNLEAIGSEHDFVESALKKLAKEMPSLEAAGDAEDVHLYPNVLKLPAFLPKDELSILVPQITNWLERALPSDETERVEDHGEYWVQAVAQIRDAVEKHTDENHWLALQNQISLPSGTGFVYGVASEVAKHDLALREFSRRGLVYRQQEHLKNRLDNIDEGDLAPFTELFTLMNERIAQPIVTKLVELINSQSSSDLDNIGSFTSLLSLFPVMAKRLKRDTAKKHSKELCANGAIFACLEKVASQRDIWASKELTELCVYLLDSMRFEAPNPHDHTFQHHSQLGNITSSVAWFNQEVLEKEHQKKTILQLAKATQDLSLDFQFIYFAAFPDNANKQIALYPKIGSELLNRQPSKPLKHTDFLKCFVALNKLNSAGAIDYGNTLDQQSNSWSEIKPLEQDTEIIDVISNADTQAWPSLLKHLDEALGNRSTEEWASDLSKNTTTLWVLENRITHGGYKLPTAQIKKPLLDHMIAVAATSQDPADEITFLLSSMTTATLKSVRHSFLETLGTKPIEGANLLQLHAAAKGFLSSLDLLSNPNVSFQKILMPILEAPNAEVAKFIKENSEVLSQIISELGEDASAQTVEILTTMNNPDGFDKTLAAQNLGVSLPEATKEIAE